MRALERCEPLCAACGQKLPRPDLPEPGMGYKHDPARFAEWREKWLNWTRHLTLCNDQPVACLDCGTVNEARFYREQS